MVQPGQLMTKADVLAVLETLPNSKSVLPHRPFAVDLTHGEPTDRGPFILGNTYNTGERVDWMGYSFVCNGVGITAPPLDPATRDPSAGWRQPWQSCYQRVRDALHEAVVNVEFGIEQWEQSVSGPWPCQVPSIFYNHIEFYYPDTGRQEQVIIGGTSPSIIGGAPAQANGKFTVSSSEVWIGPPGLGFDGSDHLNAGTPQVQTNISDSVYQLTAVTGPELLPDHFGQFNFEYASAVEFRLAVGGTKPLNVNCTITFFASAHRGAKIRDFPSLDAGGHLEIAEEIILADSADPSGLVQVDASKFLPGVVPTASFSGWQAFRSDGDSLDRALLTGSITFTATVNGLFEPGIYTLTLSAPATPNNTASGVLTIGNGTITGFNEWSQDTFVDLGCTMFITGSCGLIATDTFEVPGVHDTKRVLKIPAPPFNPATDMPTGLWTGQAYYRPTAPIGIGGSPFAIGATPRGFVPETGNPNPWVFVKEKFDNQFGLNVSASTAGFWFAVTPPVASLGLCPFERMPWNIFPVTVIAPNDGQPVNNGYLGYPAPYLYGKTITGTGARQAYSSDEPPWLPMSANNEQLPWPKRWKAQAHYPMFYTIMDANGNLQSVDREGRSGASEPAWPAAPGETVTETDYLDPTTHRTDPGVRWKLQKVLKKPGAIERDTAYTLGQALYDDNGNLQTITVAGTTATDAPIWNKASLAFTVDGTATWKLTRFGSIQPAIAHLTPTLYPCFWKNPAAGQSAPPPVLTNDVIDSSGQRPFDFKPQGWWIYRVAINKIPQTKTAEKPSSVPVAVTIGCIRNGAFVAFGTYQTGQVINAYWPVFTNTALCYQAAERVDIQPPILTCGLNYSLWGHVDFPFAATYLNDVEVLLGKIA